MPLKVFNDGRSGFRFNWPERRLRMRSLYTADAAEAEKRAAELRNGMKADEFKRKYANAPKSPAAQSLSDRMAKYRTEAPPMEAPPESANVTLDEVLSRVSEQRLGDAPPIQGPPLPDPTPVSETAADESDANSEWDDGESAKPAAKKRNWRAIGRKAANGLAQANHVLMALGIKIFGTNRKYVMRVAEASEESIATTAEGYEMLLEEWLVDHPPRPAHLIAAGNIFMAISIVAASERVERAVDEAQRAANAAGPPQPNDGTVPG